MTRPILWWPQVKTLGDVACTGYAADRCSCMQVLVIVAASHLDAVTFQICSQSFKIMPTAVFAAWLLGQHLTVMQWSSLPVSACRGHSRAVSPCHVEHMRHRGYAERKPSVLCLGSGCRGHPRDAQHITASGRQPGRQRGLRPHRWTRRQRHVRPLISIRRRLLREVRLQTWTGSCMVL